MTTAETKVATTKKMEWKLAYRYAVCINLKERDDRMKMAQERFEAVGLGGNKVLFHRVDRDPRGARFGVYEPHREIIKQAYDDGIKSVLVFEDDVMFTEGWEQVVQDSEDFLLRSNIP